MAREVCSVMLESPVKGVVGLIAWVIGFFLDLQLS